MIISSLSLSIYLYGRGAGHIRTMFDDPVESLCRPVRVPVFVTHDVMHVHIPHQMSSLSLLPTIRITLMLWRKLPLLLSLP